MTTASKFILAFTLCAFGILGFRAYKSYTDMNMVYANQLRILNTICATNVTTKEVTCVTPQLLAEITSMLSTEFPDQVKDYVEKSSPQK